MTTENDANDPQGTDTPTHFFFPDIKRQWDAGLYIIKLGAEEVAAVWVANGGQAPGQLATEHWALFTKPAFVSPAQGGSLAYQFTEVNWTDPKNLTPESFKTEVLANWPNSAPKWSRAAVEAF